MTETAAAAHVLEDLAERAQSARELESGAIYAFMTRSGPQVVNLTGDEYRDFPRRKQGTVTVADVASFEHYYRKHADEDSEIFADIKATATFGLPCSTVTAVLDAHRARASLDETSEPRWQQHRLVLKLEATPEWATWTACDRKMMTQALFAEFIEDHIADINAAGPCTGADLLEMAQQFQAVNRVQFSSGTRLATGETQFGYTETIEAKAGQRGQITIPGAFELGIRVFDDLDPYKVKARFRYRMNDGALQLGYHLDDPERKVRDAVQLVVAKVSEACGVTIMAGRP